MMRNAREERGFVLVSALLILFVVSGLGLGLLLLTNGQQRAAAREQTDEAAFELAEAALNAQITQLANKWPGNAEIGEKDYPASGCTEATYTNTNGCPVPESLKAEYPPGGSTTCPAGTKTEAWGSALSNRWTTYVRNDKAGTAYFNSAKEKEEPTWNEPAKAGEKADGKMWVRSVGVAQCHVVVLVSLVSQQFVSADFPRNTLTANWFEVSNEGKGVKEVIDTRGKAPEPGNVSMRCNGFTGTAAEIEEKCKKWNKAKEQVVIDTTKSPGSPSPTLSATQLEALKLQAEWSGTYYPASTCPSGKHALPSATLVYIEGPCAISLGGNEVINSETSPGLLIIINGTFSMGGTSVFYGEVYDANRQESSEAVVEIGGNGGLHGGINVDGNGGIKVGDSHKKNVEFNPSVAEKLEIYSGVSPTRNSFRILPAGQ